MVRDAESREPDGPRVDLWRLPRVVRVEIARVRYNRPVQRYTGPNTLAEYLEAVEIRLQTSEPFIARSIAPVLFVGNRMVPDFEPEGDNRYRFFAFDFRRLRKGSTISLGWPEGPSPRVKTEFRYEIQRQEIR